MQTIARLRIPFDIHAEIQSKASAARSSVSAIIREAMIPYLTGEKTLPVAPRNDKETSFTCYIDDFKTFKTLAEEANLSFDEAIRFILVHDYLEHTQ